MIEAVVVLGWAAHLLHWLHALTAARRDAAHASEWKREIVIRAALLIMVAMALVSGPAGRVPLPAPAVVVAALLFLVGHAVAIAGRSTLGNAWSIGTRPRANAGRQRRGLYGSLRHPIYVGVLTALVMQLVLLRNSASLVLVVAGAVVVAVKVHAEERWLSRRTAPQAPERTPARTPERTPARAPEPTLERTPARTPEPTLERTPARTPEPTLERTSVRTRVQDSK